MHPICHLACITSICNVIRLLVVGMVFFFKSENGELVFVFAILSSTETDCIARFARGPVIASAQVCVGGLLRLVVLEIHTKHHHYAHNHDITPLPDTPIHIYIYFKLFQWLRPLQRIHPYTILMSVLLLTSVNRHVCIWKFCKVIEYTEIYPSIGKYFD